MKQEIRFQNQASLIKTLARIIFLLQALAILEGKQMLL